VGVTTSAGLLQVIAAAVTPVVMISAAAVLILGVNQKHASLGDRLRALAAEFRAAGTTAERRESIRAQIRLFERRLGYVATAHLWLYASVVCFIGMVLVITLTSRSPTWDRVALGMFVLGIALMLGAPMMELVELRLAHRALDLELSDVFPGKSGAGR
jgi:Protein of unknown function (DUF2721)